MTGGKWEPYTDPRLTETRPITPEQAAKIGEAITRHQTEHVRLGLMNLACEYCRREVQNMLDFHERNRPGAATVLLLAYRDNQPAADKAATLYNADVAADGSSVDDWGYSECQRKAFVKGAEWEATRHG